MKVTILFTSCGNSRNYASDCKNHSCDLNPGVTQLSFWYRCAARRAANGGLKNGQARKIGA